MKKSLMKILYIILGFLTIFTGIWSMTQPYVTLLSLSWVYVTLLLATGCVSIANYISSASNREHPSVISLVLGILDVMLAILLLMDVEMVALSLPMILAIWIIVRGVMAIIFAFEIKKLTGHLSKGLCIVAVCMILLGYAAFVNPVVTAFGISVIIGIQMIVLGIQFIAESFV